MSITKEQHKHSATINSFIIIEVDLHNLEVEVELEDHLNLISTLLLPPQAQEKT